MGPWHGVSELGRALLVLGGLIDTILAGVGKRENHSVDASWTLRTESRVVKSGSPRLIHSTIGFQGPWIFWERK
jgi:hypothetical protein